MLQHLVDGAEKVLENASDLHAEACALHAAGALSRALLLHQISLEECAKIEMMGALAASHMMGHEADTAKLSKSFANHKAKNYTNAYLLEPSDAEAQARREKRWDDALAAFKADQAAFHADSNSAKNASLYVDIVDGAFVAPKERISEERVSRIEQLNAEFLSGAQAKLRMMTGWLQTPDTVRDLSTWFEARMTELRDLGGDPSEAMDQLITEMMVKAKETGYADAVLKRKDAAE